MSKKIIQNNFVVQMFNVIIAIDSIHEKQNFIDPAVSQLTLLAIQPILNHYSCIVHTYVCAILLLRVVSPCSGHSIGSIQN